MSSYSFQHGVTPQGEGRIVLTTSSDDGSITTTQTFTLPGFEEFIQACQSSLMQAKKIEEKN